MLKCNCYGSITFKRYSARKHFIKCYTERIYITLLITVSASCLFRWNIVNRTHNRWINSVGRSSSCYTEIGYFNFAFLRNYNILWLNVPVDNVMLMGSINSLCYLDCNAYRFPYAKNTFFFYVFLKRNTFHKFHYNVIYAILFSYIVYINDIGVHKACRSLCLSLEFRYKCLIFAVLRLEHLDCNITI